jgi:hypothetical protein
MQGRLGVNVGINSTPKIPTLFPQQEREPAVDVTNYENKSIETSGN